MAFDGVTLASVVKTMKDKCEGGRIYRVQQPEKDEIVLVIKNQKDTARLVLSADPSLPLVYLSEENKPSPMTAPNFCMFLRKYIGNGRILSVKQPHMERIVEFEIEHMTEMGDLTTHTLRFEMMGRHSNIILTDVNGRILDSIKHVPADVSSVRLVLPGQDYEYPSSGDKLDCKTIDRYTFDTKVLADGLSVEKSLFSKVIGFSKQSAGEVIRRADVEGRKTSSDLSVEEKDRVYKAFSQMVEMIESGTFAPTMILDQDGPVEYAAYQPTGYGEESLRSYEDISKLIKDFYAQKETRNNVRQKSQDLKKIIDSAIARTSKKLDLQASQMEDTKDRDKFRVYGELLNTYGYGLKGGEDSLTCVNYYDNEEITIPLDPTLSASENAKKYFNKYNKKKRTFEALTEFIEQTREELEYLLSAKHSLNLAESENDIAEIRRELIAAGEVKDKNHLMQTKKGQKKPKASEPLHFVSSEGYDIYVGKNNIQNDELSFKFASGNDMWFHAKNMPGSHVIAKRKGSDEFPDSVYEEAASLAAFYSSANDADSRDRVKVEIDYTEKKNLKKPPAAKPGYVIYHTNYSMMAFPDLSNVKKLSE